MSVDEDRESSEDDEPRCWRRFFSSHLSISARMVWKSWLEVGVRCSSSGRVRGVPSTNLEGRRARFDAEGADILRSLIDPQDTLCLLY